MAVNHSTDNTITVAAHRTLPTKTNISKAGMVSQATNHRSISREAIHNNSMDTPAPVRPVSPGRKIVA
jgi:hypothetical protein